MSNLPLIPQGPTIPGDSNRTYSRSSGAKANKALILPIYSTEESSLATQIPNSAAGMLVFDSFQGTLVFFDGENWVTLQND